MGRWKIYFTFQFIFLFLMPTEVMGGQGLFMGQQGLFTIQVATRLSKLINLELEFTECVLKGKLVSTENKLITRVPQTRSTSQCEFNCGKITEPPCLAWAYWNNGTCCAYSGIVKQQFWMSLNDVESGIMDSDLCQIATKTI